jgi:hypothetical protein
MQSTFVISLSDYTDVGGKHMIAVLATAQVHGPTLMLDAAPVICDKQSLCGHNTELLTCATCPARPLGA